MALDVVTKRKQLGDDVFVVELDSVGLELFRNFMNAFLRHTALASPLGLPPNSLNPSASICHERPGGRPSSCMPPTSTRHHTDRRPFRFPGARHRQAIDLRT